MYRLYKLASLLLLITFVVFHGKLGLTRYFDADEFAHLHWAANLVKGELPYRDFVTFFPPLFHTLLAPILKIGWMTAAPLTDARLLVFVIFVGLCFALSWVYYALRSGKNFLLPALVLAFLPMPFDKFLEIRPDTLAVGLLMVGFVLQIKNKFFWSGFFYACSLLVLTKMLPQVMFASIVVLITSRNVWFFVGLAFPIVLFVFSSLTYTSLDTLWYQLIVLPLEANKLGSQYIMAPDLFFYPNQVFYGVGGWSRGLLVNHTIWIVGILVGIYRLCTSWKRKDDFLLAGMFIVSILSFMYGFPLRHSQYLIPIAVFVSFYAAEAIEFLYKKSWMYVVIVFFVLGSTFFYVNTPKIAWNNTEDLQIVQALVHTIPTDAVVLDLVGTTLYFNDSYLLCCIPFAQWQGYMSRPLHALDLAQTSFIYEGKLDRLGGIDVAHFTRDNAVVGLWRRK